MNWSQLLDRVEERIEEAQAALARGEAPPESHAAPLHPEGGLGPLPDGLRERARTARDALAEVEARTRQMMEQVQRELGNTTRAARATKGYGKDGHVPVYVDRQA